jgi:hypothetical protein
MTSENLIPFQAGHDPRRHVGRGRPRILDTDEKIEEFAALLSDGNTVPDMAKHFKCSERTVRDYKKDIRVKTAALKHIEDRVLQITRKTDSIIAARLQHADEMDTETLLKIRKEFLGGAMRLQTTGDSKDGSTVNDAMTQLEANPELAAELEKMLSTPAK